MPASREATGTRLPTGSTGDEHGGRARGDPRGRGRRGPCARTDRDPAAADGDLPGAGDARHGARGRGGGAPAPARGCRQGDQSPVRRDPRRAARDRAQGGHRRRAETAMTLWWIGNLVLLLAVFPLVVILLKGVLDAARTITPTVRGIAATAAAGSEDLDAAELLLTTQEQVKQTVAGVAGYGGSLDVILDDEEPRGARPPSSSSSRSS